MELRFAVFGRPVGWWLGSWVAGNWWRRGEYLGRWCCGGYGGGSGEISL